jgi:hypothetical protein
MGVFYALVPVSSQTGQDPCDVAVEIDRQLRPYEGEIDGHTDPNNRFYSYWREGYRVVIEGNGIKFGYAALIVAGNWVEQEDDPDYFEAMVAELSPGDTWYVVRCKF